MNALIFLVPEDIVDVRPRLVRLFILWPVFVVVLIFATDFDVCCKFNEHIAVICACVFLSLLIILAVVLCKQSPSNSLYGGRPMYIHTTCL
jgi:hypothetical protein